MEQREQREGAQGARSLLQVERRPVELRDNETIQGDKFFSLSDHSSWSSNEQLDLEADKTSSEFESEVSSLALGKELQESGRSATVRKKQRKRSEQVGPNKHSTNPLDTKGLQGLQWEYSKDDLTLFDNGEKQPNPVSLETIYQSIMEHREESKLESRRTQTACRKMQIQIRRVAKTCSEFITRMKEAETRISRLEDEAGARQSSREMMEKQLEDTHLDDDTVAHADPFVNLEILGVETDISCPSPFKPKSTFLPAVHSEAIEVFDKDMISQLKKMRYGFKNKKYDNLSILQKLALDKLKKDASIVIRESDKGGNVVVLDKSQYLCEGGRQLSDLDCYTTANQF
ncbi:hypothetical protein NDU88_005257 [Pleurodeles waltl]|uniref:Uncharacterized protein n=1 Tax=Pleurodeles waltl TaxID=8319 RepID=A0AAV7SL90_PLEWA|nr:hypothetical protein NDU88_005257 [Pleurodeles waltl]